MLIFWTPQSVIFGLTDSIVFIMTSALLFAPPTKHQTLFLLQIYAESSQETFNPTDKETLCSTKCQEQKSVGNQALFSKTPRIIWWFPFDLDVRLL